MKTEHITDIIKEQIKHFTPVPESADVGYITEVGDGVARATGLNECAANELVYIGDNRSAIAASLDEDSVSLVILGSDTGIGEGDVVRRSGDVLKVPVGEEYLGRVVDALARPIDGKGKINASEFRPIETAAPGIIDRKSVKTPLETGIKAIDAMVPIGRGQRELIIGDRGTGKSTIAVDTIINQRGKDVVCIYVAIGQKLSTVSGIVKTLSENDAMDYTVVVSATASESFAMQYIAPYSGCALAEYFMWQGRDVLIVYDDLSKHAVAYRTMSLLIKRPPGREAYPGDVFYLHSRLLERAAKLSDKLGGGSITALPIIETQSSDVSAYIPTNVISITDGQIFLETELFHSGIRPAINPGISVSRVGGNAQIKAMKKLSAPLKLAYSQYRELKAFSQFGQDLDEDTRNRLLHGEKIVAALRQSATSPIPVELQVVILYAVVNGYLEDVDDVSDFEAELFSVVSRDFPNILESIRSGGEVDEKTEQLIITAIRKVTNYGKFGQRDKEQN